MDIVAYGLQPTFVRPSAGPSVGVVPLPCPGSEGRYQISDTRLGSGSLVVEWADDGDGSFRGYVEVPLRPGRRTRHRGWKRLRIHGSRGCEDLVGAYLVPVSAHVALTRTFKAKSAEDMQRRRETHGDLLSPSAACGFHGRYPGRHASRRHLATWDTRIMRAIWM
jgi:hypothetical protein